MDQNNDMGIKVEIEHFGDPSKRDYQTDDFTIQFNDIIEEVRRTAEENKNQYEANNTPSFNIIQDLLDTASLNPKTDLNPPNAEDKYLLTKSLSGRTDKPGSSRTSDSMDFTSDCSKFLEVELKIEDAANLNPEATMTGISQRAMDNFVAPPTSTLGMYPPVKPPRNMGEGPFPCPLCGKRFLNKRALRKHSLIHKDIKPHRCEVCAKCFIQRCDLTKHLRVHTGIKNHQCSLCPKTCGQKSDLDKHMLTHTGFKPYACQYCPKAFATKKQLVNHNYQHFGEKPFPCSVCNKSFTQKYDLGKHMLTHTGERPYACCLCHKTYTQSGDLNYHMKVHAGYKPFECDYCHKHFTNKSDLVRHISIHTKEKMHHCLVCKSSFREKFKLTRHLKSPRHIKKLEAKTKRKPRKQIAPTKVLVEESIECEEKRISRKKT